MKCCRALFKETGIAGNIKIADSFFKRLKGLMFKSNIKENEGILLRPCKQIHSYGMRFTFDAVFLNKYGEILYILQNIKQRTVSPMINDCYQVLEMKSGIISNIGLIPGDKITFENIE